MKSEAQPLRIAAGTKSAKPGLLSRRLRGPAQAVHVGDRLVEIGDPEVHHKTPVRVASVHAGFYGGSLEHPSPPWPNGLNFQPNICSKNTLDFEASDTPISMNETSPPMGAMSASITSFIIIEERNTA